jgi:ArsR family transcriptional regulator
MDRITHARFTARARIVKALAHPSRLFIVSELARQERCVCELAEMIGADMSTVSKHLAVLKNGGIVIDDKRGTTVFYKLRTPCVLNFLGCVEAVLKASAREQMKLAE